MKKILCLLLITSLSFAQNANRSYLSHTWKKNNLEIKTNDGSYQIKYLSDKIVETSFIPNGEIFNPISEAIINTNQKSKVKLTDGVNALMLYSKDLTILIDKAPFKISYLKNGGFILSEKNGYVKKEAETLEFNITPEEKLYGGGARAFETMNRRGNRLQLYNRASYGYETHADLMNFCIPMVLSSKMYAVHFDNAAIGYLDLDSKKDNTLVYETISGRKTYQVIIGDTWYEITSNYTSLTGKQPLPPRWAFGNFSSRFGYHTQEEVERTIQKFEESKIPVDAIILDLYWFGKDIKGTMGNLDWNKDNFPNPEKMIADLNKKNIKTILITEPFILTTSSKWKEAEANKILATNADGTPATWDFYFGNTGIVDVFKPQGKDRVLVLILKNTKRFLKTTNLT
jgi:oligosaccharide 4-alpha-D-glucosyltransferase